MEDLITLILIDVLFFRIVYGLGSIIVNGLTFRKIRTYPFSFIKELGYKKAFNKITGFSKHDGNTYLNPGAVLFLGFLTIIITVTYAKFS